MKKAILICLVLFLCSCTPSAQEPTTIEKVVATPVEATPIVEVEREQGLKVVTIEVVETQVVEVIKTVEVIKEVEVVKTVVVTATPKPTPKPTATPKVTIEGLQNDMTEAIINDLEGFYDVDRVNLVRWGDGALEIEFKTNFVSRDHQPDVTWEVITLMSESLVVLGKESWGILTGSEDTTVNLTSYSEMGDYRYKSSTDYDTMRKLANRSISYDEWVIAANAGFR